MGKDRECALPFVPHPNRLKIWVPGVLLRRYNRILMKECRVTAHLGVHHFHDSTSWLLWDMRLAHHLSHYLSHISPPLFCTRAVVFTGFLSCCVCWGPGLTFNAPGMDWRTLVHPKLGGQRNGRSHYIIHTCSSRKHTDSESCAVH